MIWVESNITYPLKILTKHELVHNSSCRWIGIKMLQQIIGRYIEILSLVIYSHVIYGQIRVYIICSNNGITNNIVLFKLSIITKMLQIHGVIHRSRLYWLEYHNPSLSQILFELWGSVHCWGSYRGELPLRHDTPFKQISYTRAQVQRFVRRV